MNSLIRFRTGITLGIVAAATLVGCGDDDSAPLTGGSDAGDGGAIETTGDTARSDETTGDVIDPVDTSEDVVNTTSDGELSGDASVPDGTSGEGTGSVDVDASVSSAAETSAVTSAETSAVVDTTDVVDTSAVPATTDVVDTSTVATSTADDSVVSTADVDSGVVDTTDGEGTFGPVTDDVTSEDSTVDATSTADDSTSAPAPDWIGLEVGDATAQALAVEAEGNEGFLGVVYDAAGNFYAVGTATPAGVSPDVYMYVTKFLPTGAVDTNFGVNGVAVKNVAVGGTEVVRAIALQTTGTPATQYIVIAGTAQFEPGAEGLAAAEQDVAIVRFTMEGDVDTTFGADGVVRHNLNTGIEGVRNNAPAWVSNDAVWSLGITQGDKLVLHGEQRTELLTTLGDGGTAERSDLDWVLVRLLADGSLDAGFGEGGKVTLDLDGAGATARSATVFEDGTVIGSGYLTSEILGTNTQQPVLYKVNALGEFDATFATEDAWALNDGVFHDQVVAPPLRAEAYGAAVQGSNLVTMGYGPTTGAGTGSDFVALRFTAAGSFDTSFGTNGVTYVDAAGQSDNGRSLVILPDQTILGIGGGRRLLEDNVTAVSDGMLVLLSPDGAPIQSFGDKGLRLYDLGGSNDFFWAGAVSPDETSVAIVGIKGATGTGVDADTDSSVLVLSLSQFGN